ncbi:MAG: HDOD domain-containing protein [bacterium]|nr:HDOD domain-containing protein [bacterium]
MIESRKLEHERRQRILDRIATLDTLPSLPRVVSEMLRLLAEDDYSVDELMALVQQDPALTARVLKLANSALFGRPRQIDSLHQALVLLGAKEIHRLVTTISVMRSFNDAFARGRTLDKEHFWAHSLGTGEMAARIAARFQLRFNGVDFTAGLLHDVGKVVLDQHFHAEFRDCLDLSHRRGLPQFEAENRLLGLDHAEVGALLASRWELPDSLHAAILHHHRFQPDETHAPLVACVRLANHLVKDGAMGCLGEDNHWQLELDPAWAVLEACRRSQVANRGDTVAEISTELHAALEHVRGLMLEIGR